MIRKGTAEDVAAVAATYEELLSYEEEHGSFTNWQRGVYPTEKTARDSVEEGILYVYEEDGRICASMRLNHVQPEGYEKAHWRYPAEGDEVLVIHTLCVPPSLSGRGIGKEMLAYAKEYAKNNGCKVIRFDTYEGNAPAAGMYDYLGYEYVGTIDTLFEGAITEKLKLYEYLV
jgi:ribosomal protein S18 acetylase RimI-like enzyme